ncbi:MAG: Gfo/Idh/MocA family oxidoreductase [Chloroflexi bacterium]|nr:Gfo/Idh/MocA family oxidoreductase [Chloroflexota bacterium]
MPTKDGRVGFGVIGLNFGLGRCRAIQQVPEAELVAVASRTEQTAQRVGAELGVDAYSDYHRLLARDDVDVVCVFTPNAFHRDIAIDAARAGKHLVVTKPLEITLDRVDAIIEAAEAHGVKLATEYMERFKPGHYLGYQAIADGSLGRLVTGEFTYKCFRPQSYYTGTRGTWAVDGGGVMLLQAIHSLDVMLWYLGEVESVVARTATLTHAMETEDTALALVTFTSGAMATLVGTTTFHNDRPAGQYGGGSMTRIEIGGDKGSLILTDGQVAMWKSLEADQPPEAVSPVLNTFQDMARWVRDDAYTSPTLVKAADSRRAIELILAIYESARSGQVIRLK